MALRVTGGRVGVWGAAAVAVVYLALHLPFLSSAPDDIDATNFVLALRQYDLREHQPHPPGYPVFVAMARVARAGVARVVPSAGPDAIDTYTLAFCSALFGALAVFPLVALWQAVDGNRARALIAGVLAAASPLYWYTGVRPLSDLVGLAFTLASLVLVLRGVVGPPVASDRTLFAGALLAGVAAGVRAQTLWIAGPALLVAIAVRLWRRDTRAWPLALGGLAVGLALWVVPFLIAAGGWRTYVDLLAAQAANDFRGAILAVDFSVRQLAFALRDTFVLPWGSPLLAVPVLLLALAGGVRLLVEKPRVLLLVVAVFAPYLLLHLLFHATEATRYALPLVVPVAFLAVQGLRPSARLGQIAAAALVVAAVATGMGPVVSQSRSGSPLARAWADVRQALAGAETKPAIAMHHAVQRQLRFVPFDEPPLSAPVRYEWLAVVDYFRSGSPGPVWFLADARRSDLALFDPAATRTIREYRWGFQSHAVLGGARPDAVVWRDIDRPGWMAGEGWALTPETRGVAERSRRSPGTGGAVAYIARRREPATLMFGGRNLGGPCNTAARLQATLDGRPAGEWQLPPGEPFVFITELAAGVLDGAPGYAELRMTASDLSGAGAMVDISLEQFDLQSGRKPVVALAKGWYEPELEHTTGELWRWASPRADLLVRNFDRDVVVDIRAADPMKTLGRGVALEVRAGGRIVAVRRFDSAIAWEVSIPSGVIKDAGGTITLTSDGAFVPDRTLRNGDQRELALRVLDLVVGFGGEPSQAGGS